MSIYEQMQTIEKNIATVQEPYLHFAMNQKYRELQDQLNNIEVNLL